jgi:hypothetical protein
MPGWLHMTKDNEDDGDFYLLHPPHPWLYLSITVSSGGLNQ